MESEADHMEKITHNIAYRFRIYPNREQEVLLAKTFGCCRFLYNQMLNDKIREYEASKKCCEIHRRCIKSISIFERSGFPGTCKCADASGKGI